MERLKYNEETYNILLNMAENEICYWKYQSSRYQGLIPVGHKSNERMFAGEQPEHIEEGCSCYDNPWQLVEYMQDESLDLDKTDVVLFLGTHVGYGIDGEDIVRINKEEDILYSLSLRDFYKFIMNIPSDLYWNTYNVQKKFCTFTEEFIEEVFSK